MYPNLSETDRKNLISVLLSISFEFKNEIKEEKAKNGMIILLIMQYRSTI